MFYWCWCGVWSGLRCYGGTDFVVERVYVRVEVGRNNGANFTAVYLIMVHGYDYAY